MGGQAVRAFLMAFTATVGKGVSFLTKMRFFLTISLFVIIFSVIFINSLTQSIEQRSIEPFITEIGGRLFAVTKNLQDDSLQIIEQGGIYDPEKGFFGRAWDVVRNAFNLIADIWIIYLMIKFLSWVSMLLLTGDRSRISSNITIAVVLFFVLQIIFVMAFYGPENWNVPFTAFWDFVKAFPHLIGHAGDVVGEFDEPINITNNSI